MNETQWWFLGTGVVAILALPGLGFAAMSINLPHKVPTWLPKMFFAAAIAVVCVEGYYFWNVFWFAQIIAVLSTLALGICLLWPSEKVWRFIMSTRFRWPIYTRTNAPPDNESEKFTKSERPKSGTPSSYTQDVVCTNHQQTTEVTRINDSRVIVRTSVVRTLENVSESPVVMDIILAIDEWLEDGAHSEIYDIGYTLGDAQHKSLLEYKKKDVCAITIGKHPVSLKKGEHVRITQTWQEVKRATDSQFSFYGYSTQDPTVTVKAPSDIPIWATSYVGHGQPVMRPQGGGIFRLDGTLLPQHAIEVHWYEKDKSEKWMSEQDQVAPKRQTARGATR